MRSDKLILALAVVCLLLTLRCPAHAAPQWNVITVIGTGGQTSEYMTCFGHSSTKWSCLNRRATSMTGVLTVYTVTGVGVVTATDYTPPTPTYFVKALMIGGDATTIILGGTGRWAIYASLSSDLSQAGSWTTLHNTNASTSGWGGIVYTSPAGGGKFRFHQNSPSDSVIYTTDYTLSPFSPTGIANSSPIADESEVVSVPVSGTFVVLASAVNATGQSYFRGYVSGASYAFTTNESSASANTGSYYYQPFAMNDTLGAFTVKKQSNSEIYIRWVNAAGTITQLNTGSTTDLRPGCDTDDFTGARLGWWVGAADGKLYKSNSISAPTSVSNDATYDMGSTALQSSTPVVMFCSQWNGSTVGVDINQDGTAGDPIVLLANKGLAYYGEPPVVASSAPRPKPQRTGPYNSLPFRGP